MPSGTFEVPLLGAYNVRNALAAIAVGSAVGLDTDTMAEGLRRFRGRAAPHAAPRHGGAAWPSTTTSRIIRLPLPKRWTACARRIPTGGSGRSSSRDRRRRAGGCSTRISRARSPGRDRVILPAVFRSSLPDAERLSPEALVADLVAAGIRPPTFPGSTTSCGRHARVPRRGSRHRHVQRRIRRHPPEAPCVARGAGGAGLGPWPTCGSFRPATPLSSSNCRPASTQRPTRASSPSPTRCGRGAVPCCATSSSATCTATVYFDPLAIDAAWVEAGIRAGRPDRSRRARSARRRHHRSAGLLRRTLGPDLARVAAYAARTEQDVVLLHTGPTYRVYVVGFIPGFPYMAAVDPPPRAASPRRAADAGAAGIRRDRGRPDRHLSGRDARRMAHHRPDVDQALRSVPRRAVPLPPRRQRAVPRGHAGRLQPSGGMPALTVVRPGMLTTVQDPGRWGHQGSGVPVAGSDGPVLAPASRTGWQAIPTAWRRSR